MEDKILNVNNRANSKVLVSNRHFSGDKEYQIDGVSLGLESSTTTARVFNIALKLATLDWTDDTLDKVEKLVNDRIGKLTKTKIVK